MTTAKKIATIRKWTSEGWGVANAPHYSSAPGEIPKRYFVHVSRVVSEEVVGKLGLGVKILFIEGAPRHKGELPVALEIEIAQTPSHLGHALLARPLSSPEVK